MELLHCNTYGRPRALVWFCPSLAQCIRNNNFIVSGETKPYRNKLKYLLVEKSTIICTVQPVRSDVEIKKLPKCFQNLPK